MDALAPSKGKTGSFLYDLADCGETPVMPIFLKMNYRDKQHNHSSLLQNDDDHNSHSNFLTIM